MVDVDIDHIGPYSVQIKEFDTQSLPDELALAGITYIDPVTDWFEKLKYLTQTRVLHMCYIYLTKNRYVVARVQNKYALIKDMSKISNPYHYFKKLQLSISWPQLRNPSSLQLQRE